MWGINLSCKFSHSLIGILICVWVYVRLDRTCGLEEWYCHCKKIRFACWVIFQAFVVFCWIFSNYFFFKKFFQQHYQSVKQFRSISGQTFCWSWSGSKLYAKVIIKRWKSPLVNLKRWRFRSGSTQWAHINHELWYRTLKLHSKVLAYWHPGQIQ